MFCVIFVRFAVVPPLLIHSGNLHCKRGGFHHIVYLHSTYTFGCDVCGITYKLREQQEKTKKNIRTTAINNNKYPKWYFSTLCWHLLTLQFFNSPRLFVVYLFRVLRLFFRVTFLKIECLQVIYYHNSRSFGSIQLVNVLTVKQILHIFTVYEIRTMSEWKDPFGTLCTVLQTHNSYNARLHSQWLIHHHLPILSAVYVMLW